LNKTYLGAVVYFLLIISAGVLVAEYVTATRDISWINEVEDFIKKEDWVPDSEYVPMQDWAFFLYENGTEQYFYLTNQKEFISNIDNILNQVNRQVEESISEDLLDEILATGKVLELVHRFPTKSEGWVPTNEFDWKVDYRIAYFVLDDKSNSDFEGTIITRETNSKTSKISVWQITKSNLW
jgi:hypothetical protein